MELSSYKPLSIISLIPISGITLWLNDLIAVGTLVILLAGFIFVFVIVPIIYRCSYSVQRNLLFLNFVSFPVDYKHPEKQRLLGTRNFYINSTNDVSLGVWHVLPAKKLPNLLFHTLNTGETNNASYDSWLGDGDPIFIYMHGNSGNRAAGHRVELYKILQQNNYHVITYDYRSYGDSSSVQPSEEGVVSDSISVYRWVKERSKNSKIFFWGHSLGTGISSHTLSILEAEGEEISGLILECPFNNLRDEVRSYPLAKMFRVLPWFDFFFTNPMYENGLRFETDKHLSTVKTPILILHAEDDVVVPYILGKKLFEMLETTRGSNQLIKFIPFKKELHHGHKQIYRDKQLPEIVRTFVSESLEYKRF